MKRNLSNRVVLAAGNVLLFTALAGEFSVGLASAQPSPNFGFPACAGLPGQAALQAALAGSVGVSGNGP
jgi:hypothetical protein